MTPAVRSSGGHSFDIQQRQEFVDQNSDCIETPTSLSHCHGLEDDVVGGDQSFGIDDASLPCVPAGAVLGVLTVKEHDQRRHVDEDAHSAAASAKYSSCHLETSPLPERKRSMAAKERWSSSSAWRSRSPG